MTIWTVGHSTLPIEAFLDILGHYGIEAIADVRRFPGSRRHPQFGEAALRESLASRGIGYRWLPALGGRRKARADSPNTGWRNASFRGYADHIGTPEFAAGLAELLKLAEERRTAMMCAEVLWWRCHRALISDVLRIRGVEVVHIQDREHAAPHRQAAPAGIAQGALDLR
jgi:uncharacterized protein (DUF488 family)